MSTHVDVGSSWQSTPLPVDAPEGTVVPRRSRKPKRPKADASADCLMRYQLAMATWAELNVEYQRAQSARTKLLVAQAGKRRPPRPASVNLARAERRRNSPAQQADDARYSMHVRDGLAEQSV